MVTMAAYFSKHFHRDLASPAWLLSLASHVERALAAHPEYQTSDGQGWVRSEYSADRYMGPQSVVKFEFIVDVSVARNDSTQDHDRYRACVRYLPSTGAFKTKREFIDTTETRAREREGAHRRRAAQESAANAFEQELGEFVRSSEPDGARVPDEKGPVEELYDRFRRAVVHCCLLCRRALTGSVYLIRRTWANVVVYRTEYRLVTFCADCIKTRRRDVVETLRRFWKALPEPSQSCANFAEGEWGHWTFSIEGFAGGKASE